jgi:hypothetical protein
VKRVLLFFCVIAAGCNHPPRLDAPMANEQREIVNPATPTPKEHDIEGRILEDRDDLASLADKARPGDTIDVKLGPGVYVIDRPIVVKGAKLVIRGPGADRTRIKLSSDDWRALTVDGSPDFELRGVTVAGYTGGGIDAKNCGRVVINECDFAGSRYGLELAECGTAFIDSCCFAGCEKAIKYQRTHLVLRGTAIEQCWGSLVGSGVIEASGCVFASNVDGANISARPGSSFRSCLFGRNETFNSVGEPDVKFCFLFDDLYERFELPGNADGNSIIHDVGEFPDALSINQGMNLGSIHYAVERFNSRGLASPGERIRDILEAQARKYAQAAQKAVAGKDVSAARWLQQIALDYVHAVGGGEEALRDRIQGIVP